MTGLPDHSAACALQQLHTGDVGAIAGRCPDLFTDTAWNARALERVLAAPGYFALLAHTAGQAAGLILARATAGECEILWILVGPSWRRKGVGRRLLRSALRHAAGLGACAAYLEVAETNGAAIALYGTEGFRAFGRSVGYYRNTRSGQSFDALLYKKELESSEGSGPPMSMDDMKTPEAQAR